MTRRPNRTSDMIQDLSPKQLEHVRGGDGDAERKRKDYRPIVITKPYDQASPML
jgi:hypothetical protein